MRKLLFGLFLLGMVLTARSQQSVLHGKVIDTLEKKSLQNAVVSLLRKSDSVLSAFSRTGKNGEFFVAKLVPGKYILLVSYPRFADFADEIEVKDQPVNELGQVSMTLRSSLLEAVVIRSAGAIRIKGDTTEFVADSFQVKEGATVEDLLKKLPGFQVNSKGEITTQGQRVQKVLVDGEEFFGDDPTMATQNIGAKMVDKVQVYDTKTEQQNLTGMSTGTEGKTVNIKLKENARRGAFGKAHLGSDPNGLIDAKALYNRFVGSMKMSVYGTKSDVSTGTLNWQDKEKLGIEDDYEYDEVTGYYTGFDQDGEFSNWSLRGLPHSYSAGALYSNKWREGKNNLNTSYRYNRLLTVNNASTLTQNILSSGITYRNKYQDTRGLNQQHIASGKYEWKIDSLTSIKLTSTGTYKTNDLSSNMNSEFLDEGRHFINNGSQLNNNHSLHKQWDNQLQYKQLFKKKNREFIATLRYGHIEDDQSSIIQTRTNFYEAGAIDSIDQADQQKILAGRSNTIGTKLTWSEPLSSAWALVTEYGYNRNSSLSQRNTFDKDASGKYLQLNRDFSNNFDLDVEGHSATAILKYSSRKIKAAFGSGVSNIQLKLFNVDSNRHNQYRFFHLTPQGNIAYMYKPQSRIFFGYRGTTRPPSIDQLQPIRDNSDRLNEFRGNPNLKVGFNHSFNLGFNTYKVLKQRGIFSNFSYNIPVNAITFNNSLDISRGKQTYMPVNVNGNRNWSGWFSLFKQGGEKKAGYFISLNVNGARNTNFINGNRNATEYLNTEFNPRIRYGQEDKHNIDFGPTVGYNRSRSSLNPQFNTRYWNYGGSIEGMIMLPGKLELSSDCRFDLRQHLAAFPTNPNQITWNAGLAKKVFKDKSGKIYLVANDILDQNKGFNRDLSSNFITEERYSKLSRYFLLKFEWSFSKMPGQKKN